MYCQCVSVFSCLCNLICSCCSDLNVSPGPRVYASLSVSTPGVTSQTLGGSLRVHPQPVELPLPGLRPGPREVTEQKLRWSEKGNIEPFISELTETLNF